MEPHLYNFSTNHCLASLSVMETFLKLMLHYNHFQQYIGKLELKHVRSDQLVQLDKTQYTILYFCQYLDSTARWNIIIITPSIS